MRRTLIRNADLVMTMKPRLGDGELGLILGGMADQIGSLAPGKQADVLVLNPQTLNFAPRFDDVSQLVCTAQLGNVEWVWVEGRVLQARGQLVGVDAEAVMATANRVVRRVRTALLS